MRFLILIKADKRSEAGIFPSQESIMATMKFNEELAKAGVLLSAEGGASEREGRARQILRSEAHRDRRTLSRDEGADRRLLDVAGAIESRCHRMGQAHPLRRRRGG